MRSGAFSRGVNPAFELAAVKRAITRTIGGETFRRIVILQHCRGGDDFEDRARSELSLNGTIEERAEGIFVELLPFFLRDAHGEIVRIRRRTADHGEDFASTRIE